MPSSLIKKLKTGPGEKHPGREPPRFTVDLSIPAEHRYDHIVPLMKESIKAADIDELFDSLLTAELSLDGLGKLAPRIFHAGVRGLARIALRRVYTSEETAELRGISKAAGIPMFLLVVFNVLLDLLLGCTSGGVLFQDDEEATCDTASSQGDPASGNSTGTTNDRFRKTPYRRARGQAAASVSKPGRIVHFRTLDWGMDSLRHLVVQLDFVRCKDGPTVASTVGYFGYVGVLTGVRHGLSMSLNHRATHDRSTWRKRLSFRWHQLMVVLGQRPSISSTLRHYLLAPNNSQVYSGKESAGQKSHKWKAWQGLHHPLPPSQSRPQTTADGMPININPIITALSTSPSTAAYLVFCTPQQAYSLELDNGHIVSTSSSPTFLATTNHDISEEGSSPNPNPEPSSVLAGALCGMEEILQESVSRKEASREAYDKLKRKRLHSSPRGSNNLLGQGQDHGNDVEAGSQTEPEPLGSASTSNGKSSAGGINLTLNEVITVLNYKDIIDPEVTHYAAVMDPSIGGVLWRRVFDVPDE